MAELESSGRILPNSYEAEQSVLGSILISPKALTAAETLRPEDFYSPQHREIFSVMQELDAANKAVDLVTVTERLEARGSLSGAGGAQYISDLSMMVPSAANVGHYISIIEEKATLRRLIDAGGSIVKNGFDEAVAAENQLDEAEKLIYDIATHKKTDSMGPISEALRLSMNMIGEAMNRRGELPGLSTGFASIDRKTAGFQKSQLIVIGGRPGTGKTSFALNIAAHAAKRHKVPVVVFSLEMSKEQLASRMLCSEAGVDLQSTYTGRIGPEEIRKLSEAQAELSETPIYLDDQPGITVPEIRSRCRRMKMHNGLGMVIIDYLQLIQGSGKTENRQLEISEMTRMLKIMARDLDCPVVVLSQLRRLADTREGKKPQLSDLRESGAIEQDADIVMLLFRDIKNEEGESVSGVSLAKQRNGPTGDIMLKWIGEFTKFAELDERHDEY